jgi:hypothetical protein
MWPRAVWQTYTKVSDDQILLPRPSGYMDGKSHSIIYIFLHFLEKFTRFWLLKVVVMKIQDFWNSKPCRFDHHHKGGNKHRNVGTYITHCVTPKFISTYHSLKRIKFLTGCGINVQSIIHKLASCWDLRSSGTLRNRDQYLATKLGPTRPETSVSTDLRSVTSQKSEDLMDTTPEAWNDA